MSSRKHQIVIVGGGTAGLTVAARLRRADSKLDVAVIEPSDKHYYQPLWTLVGGGILPKEETERNEGDVMPDGVEWIQDAVEAFDPDGNSLTLKSGGTVEYDYLVVAPGIQIDWHKIKGLEDALGKDGVSSNYDYRYADKTWEFIKGFEGGNAVFTFPTGPIKCAGAPQKIMWLAEHHFEKAGLRDKANVIFASAGDKIFGVQKYRTALEELVEKRRIDTRWKHDLVEIRAASKEAVFKVGDSEEVISYDIIHVTPPMSAPDFIKESKLAGEAGWVDVDKFTTQHVRYPNVFSCGDASSLPTSKTGAAVRKEAPVLVSNLLAVKAGKEPTAKYDGYTSCPLVTGYGRLILAEFDYDGNPAETFPFNQAKERWSMYVLKRHLLPPMYWKGMLRGRA
ncbi:MAG: NAD(P)/FAD-dependent oxidoreductase [Deltaproteobacteria bacterium]|jgi:sulfide:quinone oxidoreductase|nr:NAD(P)/FAD-dependent oxidoreductase [Deltaproteobacteria bacterium]